MRRPAGTSWTSSAAGSPAGSRPRPRASRRARAAPRREPETKGSSKSAAKAKTAQLLVDRNDMITEEVAQRLEDAGIEEVLVRLPLTCEARYGVCRRGYGRPLAPARP